MPAALTRFIVLSQLIIGFAIPSFAQFAAAGSDSLLLAKAHRDWADRLSLSDSTKKTIYHFDSAIRLFQRGNDEMEAVSAMIGLGKFLRYRGKYEESLKVFNEALALARKIKDQDKEAEALLGSGIVYTNQGNLLQAMNDFVNALDLYQDLKDQKGIADAWHQIGVIHWKEGKFTDALNAYEKALKIRYEISDSIGIAASLSNIGVINKLQQKYDTAMSYYEKSLEIRKKNNDQLGLGQVLFNIGSLLDDQEKLNEALDYYAQSLHIKDLIHDDYGKLAVFLNTGGTYKKLKKYAASEQAFLNGLSASKEIGANGYAMAFLRELSVLYEGMGKFEQAYKFHRQYMAVKDTLVSEEKNFALAEMQAKYEVAEKERDIATLENEKKINEEKSSRERVFRALLIVIVVLTIVVAILFFSRVKNLQKVNKKLNEQKTEIEKKDAEKEILMREIHHRVKNNLQLTSSLLNLQARQAEHETAATSLKEARDRIKAISLIHDQLYVQNGVGKVQLEHYVPDLCASISNSSGIKEHEVQFFFHIDPVVVELDFAISVGLLLNEAITNSIKHAFKDVHPGTITISIANEKNGLKLSIADNGSGFQLNGKKNEGFGLELIRSLASKLQANLTVTNNNGAVITVSIPTIFV